MSWRAETKAYSGVIDKSIDQIYESLKGAYPGHIAETIKRACELAKQQVRVVAAGASLQYDPETILKSAGANRLWKVELTGHEHNIEDRNSSPCYLTVTVSEIFE